MSPSFYAILYSEAEKRHGFPANLLRALAVQESAENPWAVRYEPGFFTRYLMGKGEIKGFWPPRVTEETERRLRACSFGLLQIMGQVARELGFRGTYLTALCDPTINVALGAQHLADKQARRSGDLRLGLSDYNDGGAWSDRNVTTYADVVLGRMRDLTTAVG